MTKTSLLSPSQIFAWALHTHKHFPSQPHHNSLSCQESFHIFVLSVFTQHRERGHRNGKNSLFYHMTTERWWGCESFFSFLMRWVSSERNWMSRKNSFSFFFEWACWLDGIKNFLIVTQMRMTFKLFNELLINCFWENEFGEFYELLWV